MVYGEFAICLRHDYPRIFLHNKEHMTLKDGNWWWKHFAVKDRVADKQWFCMSFTVYIYIYTYLQIAFFVSFACNVKVACLQSAK